MTGSKNPRIAEISDIVQWIKYHCNHEPDKRKPGLTFLIGAGFSASAGIPTAGPMIENSLRKHELLKNVGPIPKDKSEYTYLMSQLPPVERIKVVRAAIQGAEDEATGRLKINWAHLLMATLVDAGYINQILTTNFDPLMVEALSIIGQPVRVFDLSAGSGFQADALQKGSIIYLHGQSHSMWICNAQEELDRVRPHLNAVFQDALRDSIFIIVGYSGNCDPVLQELIDRFPVFSHRLYWVHHDPTTNPGELAMQLLTDYSREAFLVKDLDADAFMRELVLQGLELELPLIVKNPLDSLTRNLARIMPFPKKEGEPTPDDPVDGARNLVMKANDMVKSQSKGDLAWSNELISIAISMAAMTYSRSKIEELRTKVEPLHNKELNQQLGDAYILLASKSLDHEQIEQAIEDLRVAENLGVQEQHWLHTTWGNALSAQARTKDGAEADSLFNQSYEKYTEAIRIKREMHEAWNNWGIALSAQARTKDGAEADPLFKQSYEKYAEAICIKRDDHEVWNNWGIALSAQAETKDGAEADALFNQSYEKYAEAVRIKRDDHEAWYNWGTALSDQAETKDGAEADALFNQACEKYAEAVRIKPDYYKAWHNWGTNLLTQAEIKDGAEADALCNQACEKFAEAVRIKPDFHEAWNNWGTALSAQARTKDDDEADPLFKQSYEKYAEAICIKRDDHEVWNNWGTALSDQARTKNGVEADALFKQSYEKYAEAVRIKPEMHKAWNNWGTALIFQAKTKASAEADALFNQACEKYREALHINPQYRSTQYNMACLSGLRGSADEAVYWLGLWFEGNPVANKADIRKDGDFDRVRDTEKFRTFLDGLN